eukprot:TRINITY_DN28307_c0_g1_i1.p1 TRINITY_DN28307_c0_g1~~TRINITY_DN28307_c0_g1_i1.p1  ORF type:complete len:117 (+),score=8.04 TRINITY_DN28307_c0_g1_i1:81-431(+)
MASVEAVVDAITKFALDNQWMLTNVSIVVLTVIVVLTLSRNPTERERAGAKGSTVDDKTKDQAAAQHKEPTDDAAVSSPASKGSRSSARAKTPPTRFDPTVAPVRRSQRKTDSETS